MNSKEKTNVLMISSFGGGGHKAYAQAYKQSNPNFDISEWSIEYINSSRVPGRDTDTVVGGLSSKVFNYIQRKGLFFILRILVFLYPIMKFFSGRRIRNNTCRILEHCLSNGNLPNKIEIVQPTWYNQNCEASGNFQYSGYIIFLFSLGSADEGVSRPHHHFRTLNSQRGPCGSACIYNFCQSVNVLPRPHR